MQTPTHRGQGNALGNFASDEQRAAVAAQLGEIHKHVYGVAHNAPPAPQRNGVDGGDTDADQQERLRPRGNCNCWCRHCWHSDLALWDLFWWNSVTDRRRQRHHRSRRSPRDSREDRDDDDNSNDDVKDSDGGSKLLAVIMAIAFAVCTIVVFVYNLADFCTLVQMINKIDSKILLAGGTTAERFAQWKRNELPYWYIHAIGLGLLALDALWIVGAVAIYGTATLYVASTIVATIVAAYLVYHVTGRKKANRLLLADLVQKLDAVDPVPHPDAKTFKAD